MFHNVGGDGGGPPFAKAAWVVRMTDDDQVGQYLLGVIGDFFDWIANQQGACAFEAIVF